MTKYISNAPHPLRDCTAVIRVQIIAATDSSGTRMTEVKESTLPNAGMGLFATRDYSRGSRVTFLDGEVLTRGAFLARHGDDSDRLAPYAIEATHQTYIDAADETLCAYPGRYANHGDSRDCNALFIVDSVCRASRGARPYRVSIKARRAIAAGDEIFVNYGADYWRGSCAASSAPNITIPAR